MVKRTLKSPSMVDALIPIGTLILLLFLSVHLFGDDSSYGANQIALIIAAGVGAIIAMRNGLLWNEVETAIVDGIAMAMGAILILLAVGSLIGTWILAGIVPTMIYYGLQILEPSYFYVASCLICSIIALSIGSSWTVAGTVGIGLIGVAAGLELSLPITAGAIISGAYFGDKMSPLSDTTNLAPAVAGTDLFTHIRHMTWTTVPSLLIALILFTVIGLNHEVKDGVTAMQTTLRTLEAQFTISLFSLVPLLVVLLMAMRKIPALPTILAGALLGGVFAVIFQTQQVIEFVNNPELARPMSLLAGVWMALYDGYSANTGNPQVDDLLSRGGMSSMLNTVWLIVTAMSFGAVMEKAGLLQKLVASVLKMAHSTGSLIATVLGTCIGMNIIAADQYMAIVLPGRMYRAEFKRRGLASKNLSRTLEDAGTITSPLVPWNTCGAYMSATLGVATFAYLPFCFFNLANPVISLIYGVTHFKIARIEDSREAEETGPVTGTGQ